tara:strand:- start:113 stop:367 length:255 start_codon:yes stop_codon:yes gene_type:complete
MKTFDMHQWRAEFLLKENSGKLNENEASNKELLLELVDGFKSELENVDDSEWDVETSKSFCDDATMELQDLKDHFTSKQSREDI